MAELQAGPYWAIHSVPEDADRLALFESGIGHGVLKGDTIADLAEQAGIDPAALQATFDRYNALAEAGDDADFGKVPESLIPYDEGPYYMVRMVPAICDVLGGIQTNQEYAVIRADGTPIPNLYAAGSMSNKQYYNQWYFSGSSLTFASTAGRIAGAQAATNGK